MAACSHASVASLHESTVQDTSSAQLRAVPLHWPLPQTSFTVQKAPSSHETVLFVCWQVPEPLQVSLVQTFESLVHSVPLGL